jgi:hypothetical protein
VIPDACDQFFCSRFLTCFLLLCRFVSEKNEKDAKVTIPNTMEDILDNKSGLLIVPMNRDLHFTVSPYTDAQILEARHANELTSTSSIYVRLDAAQRGLGTGSCGPQTLTKYQVNGGSYNISFWIKPIESNES